jgi:hypothetical protein
VQPAEEPHAPALLLLAVQPVGPSQKGLPLQVQPSATEKAWQFSLLVCRPQMGFVPTQPPAQTQPSVKPEPVVHASCVAALPQ